MATKKLDNIIKSIKKKSDTVTFEDLLNSLERFRNQTPNEQVLAILKQMLEFLKVDNSLKSQFNLEILLIIQDIVKKSFYDNPCSPDILKIVKEINNVLKPVEFKESDFPDLTETKRRSKIPSTTNLMPVSESSTCDATTNNHNKEGGGGSGGGGDITIKTVSNQLFETVAGLKEKWLSSDDKTALEGYEEDLLKMLMESWDKFEIRFRQVNANENTERNILKSIHDLLGQFDLKSGLTNDKSQTNSAVIPIIELTDKKSFKDIEHEYILELMSQITTTASETAVSIPNNQECFINFNKIWCNNSRWLGLKYKLLQKGLNKVNQLYLSYPIFRNEFIISPGETFGKIEIGFSKNFHGVAVRRLTEFGIDPENCAQLVKLVDNNLSKLTHTNLLRSGICQDICGHTFFYNKLCEYNLHGYMQLNYCNLEKWDAKKIMYQMLKGLSALHMSSPLIVHGNLKPTNILIDENGIVKLAEFGIYKYLNYLDVRDTRKIWWPPEIHHWYNIMGTYNCTVMSDVYACGMCLYFIKNGIHPYGDDTAEIVENLSSGNLILKPELVDLDLYSLLYFVLDSDAQVRPNVVEILNHIYFWSDARRFEFLQKIITIFSKKRDEFKIICNNSKFITILWRLSKYSNFQYQSGLLIDRLDDVKHYLNETGGQYGIGGSTFSEIPVLIYNLLLESDWFQMYEELRKFSPNAITLDL